MPRYEIGFKTQPSFIDPVDPRRAWPVNYRRPDKTDSYQLTYDPRGGYTLISPIEADTHEEAVALARRVVDLCLNRLSVESGFSAHLEGEHTYQNLDRRDDAGKVMFITTSAVGKPQPLPDSLEVSDDQSPAAYFRQAVVAAEPFDRYRNYYLAIEAAGKRIRPKTAPNKTAEGKVVEDTVEEVFKKTKGEHADVQAFRAKLPDADLPKEFQGGNGHARRCVNEYVYQQYRCCLMHAGATKAAQEAAEKVAFVPYNPKDELRVRAGLPLIAELARRYVTYTLNHPPK